MSSVDPTASAHSQMVRSHAILQSRPAKAQLEFTMFVCVYVFMLVVMGI